jgi:hypothetical protein
MQLGACVEALRMRALRTQTARLGVASAVGSRRGGSLKAQVRSLAEDELEIRYRSRASMEPSCSGAEFSLGITCTQHVSSHTWSRSII